MSNQQYPPQQPQQPGWVPPQQPGWTPPPPRPPRKRSIGKILGIGCGGIFGLFILLAALGAALGGSKTSNASDSKPTHAASAKSVKASASPTVDSITARCRAEHWPQAMPKLAGQSFNPLDKALECFDHLKALAPDGHDVMNDTGANAQPWTIVSSQPAAGAQVNLSTPIVLKLREPDAATTKPAATPSHAATVQKPATHEPAPVTPTHTTEPPVDDHGGATALCNDGTLSYSAHHQGTCSHHHGVAVWYK